MPAEIIAEAPVAGYVAPVFTIVNAARGRRPAARKPLPGTGGTVFQLPPRPAWSPAVNVFDTGDAFVVIAELAGVGPDSLKIELDAAHDVVTLRGVRAGGAPSIAAEFDPVDEEITSGRFEREILLDAPVDPRGAKAVCRYGLLELMLPKLKTRDPKREPINPPTRTNKRRSIAC
jgi:HSP20 family protein